jgi:hypothetical protein
MTKQIILIVYATIQMIYLVLQYTATNHIVVHTNYSYVYINAQYAITDL